MMRYNKSRLIYKIFHTRASFYSSGHTSSKGHTHFPLSPCFLSVSMPPTIQAPNTIKNHPFHSRKKKKRKINSGDMNGKREVNNQGKGNGFGLAQRSGTNGGRCRPRHQKAKTLRGSCGTRRRFILVKRRGNELYGFFFVHDFSGTLGLSNAAHYDSILP